MAGLPPLCEHRSGAPGSDTTLQTHDASDASRSSSSRWPLTALCFALSALCVEAFFRTGEQYGDYLFVQGRVMTVDETELSFFAWYALWGSLATGFAAAGLYRSGLPDRLLAELGRVQPRAWPLVCGVALVCACLCVFLHDNLMLQQPVADDELAYRFEAQTLLLGRVVSPPVPDSSFYQNQFIITSPRGRVAQYPVGHPAVLAVGMALHMGGWIVPLLGLCSVLLTFAVGRRLFDVRIALLAACLLSLSPQFVLTHATQLSQPTSALALLFSLWAQLRLQDRPSVGRAALLGLALGFAVLVRPMPALLLLPVVLLAQLTAADAEGAADLRSAGRQLVRLWPAALGLGLCALLLAQVNRLQSGSASMSGYDAMHGGSYVKSLGSGSTMANSIGGAFIRQNFWLLGWPLSFAFVPFARLRRGSLLFWGAIVAVYAYRLLVPKTVVATTGPVYVFELVPLLVLATVSGAATIAQRLRQLSVPRASALVLSCALAASGVGLCSFVPVQLQAIATGASARARIYQLLEQARASRALVFANELVISQRGVTWSYFPPSPSPTLEDELVFVRLPREPGGLLTAHTFWQRHYPERRAFLFLDTLDGVRFEELSATQPPPPTASMDEIATPTAAP